MTPHQGFLAQEEKKGVGRGNGFVRMRADSWKGTCCDSHTLLNTEAYCLMSTWTHTHNLIHIRLHMNKD